MPRKKTGAAGRGNLALVPETGAPVLDGSAAKDTPLMAPNMPQSFKDHPDLIAAWDEVVPQLDKAGLLSPADGMAVEMIIRHLVIARRASEELASDELVLEDPKNDRYMKNPTEAIFRMESKEIREYAKQLGMTFMSRARTPSQRVDDDEDNPFAGTGS